MSGRFWNIVIGTATVSMAWVGFLLSVAATILNLCIPVREEISVLRLDSRRTSSSVHTALQERKRTLRDVRTNPTTPSTPPGLPTPTSIPSSRDVIVADSAERNISYTTHRLPKPAPIASPEPPSILSSSVSTSEDSISSQEQIQGASLKHAPVSLRTPSFQMPVFKRCSERKRGTLRSISPSRTTTLPSTTTLKPPCLKYPKQLQKVPSVPIMAGRKTTPPARTRPYEAPYFLPTPGSPAAADYGRQFRATPLRRAATSHEPLASRYK